MDGKIKLQFEKDGYVVAKDLFTQREMAATKDEVRRVLADIGSSKPGRHNGVVVGLTLRSPFFKRFNTDQRLTALLNATLGPNIEFLSDKVVFKTGGVDFGSPWHQDWAYWKGAHKVSFWIALDDANRENGCLRVIPGSHKEILNHDGDAGDGHGFKNRLKGSKVNESLAMGLVAPQGSVVLFHDLLLHASYPNTSGRDRWALIPTYRDASQDDLPYVDRWPAAFMVSGERSDKVLDVGAG